MSYKLKKIDRQWRMESVSDPFFKYEEDGLEVSFMIFINESEREKDMNTYMQENNIKDKQDIPDDVYNNAGYAIIYFKFNGFDSLSCVSTNDFLKRIDEADEVIPGVYKEIGNDEKENGYIFIGHDISLSVRTKKNPSEAIKKLSC
ncbi:hypothetical protein FJU30_09250 [Affinibrenneria salicis]|uniref:Uncharacterized protein n=1 Tax=Affinibrenneria salicis TaxID=2590031 RepID=A0A5J5G141_9GAMM|nr:hypothetical protein [Affinibrenneria salicis]KAA9000434.1 hypothetical protein FJU30_09250 [Affinibrenneria salicis]